MNTVVNDLVAKAQALPPIERAHLIESLIQSMQQVDVGVEAQWATESEARLNAIERGEMLLEDEPRLLADFRAKQR